MSKSAYGYNFNNLSNMFQYFELQTVFIKFIFFIVYSKTKVSSFTFCSKLSIVSKNSMKLYSSF